MTEKKQCCSKLKGAWGLIVSAIGAVVLAVAGIFALKKRGKKNDDEDGVPQD